MYCTNCGKKLSDHAKFCDECGTKTKLNADIGAKNVERTTLEGKVHKCPSCGEILRYDALFCPSCRYEIRDKKSTSSMDAFHKSVSLETNEAIKIELIKTFPIPNSREDIIEFMLLAISNFDIKFYTFNKSKDSVSNAWLFKIEQAYKKGKMLFTDKDDLLDIESLYNEVHHKIKSEQNKKIILTILEIVVLILSIIILTMYGQTMPVLGYISIATLFISIVLIVKRSKKNKMIDQAVEKESIKIENNEHSQFKHSIFNASGRVVNKNIYVFLALTLGIFGAHRRYAGKRSSALLYLFTFGLFGIGWVSDIYKGITQKPDIRGNIIV